MYSCACQIGECILCEANLLSGLTREQVCQIRGLLSKQAYPPRAMLFRVGEPSRHLFVLRSGQVKLATCLSDGREQILGVRVPGQMLGIGSLSEHKHPYSAEALTPVEVCRIEHKDMLAVLEQNPTVSLGIIQRLNQELQQSQALIRDLGLKSAPEKVASFLLSLTPGQQVDSEPVPLPLSRREMAELLGLTVETTSRVITRFRRDGVIQASRGHMRILDYARLQSLAGDPDASAAARAATVN
jgi:CRP/FNR family transcriptional regulator